MLLQDISHKRKGKSNGFELISGADKSKDQLTLPNYSGTAFKVLFPIGHLEKRRSKIAKEEQLRPQIRKLSGPMFCWENKTPRIFTTATVQTR